MSEGGAVISLICAQNRIAANNNLAELVIAIFKELDQDDKHGEINVDRSLGEWIIIAEAELADARNALIKGSTGRDAVKMEIIQTIATLFACMEQHGAD